MESDGLVILAEATTICIPSELIGMVPDLHGPPRFRGNDQLPSPSLQDAASAFSTQHTSNSPTSDASFTIPPSDVDTLGKDSPEDSFENEPRIAQLAATEPNALEFLISGMESSELSPSRATFTSQSPSGDHPESLTKAAKVLIGRELGSLAMISAYLEGTERMQDFTVPHSLEAHRCQCCHPDQETGAPLSPDSYLSVVGQAFMHGTPSVVGQAFLRAGRVGSVSFEPAMAVEAQHVQPDGLSRAGSNLHTFQGVERVSVRRICMESTQPPRTSPPSRQTLTPAPELQSFLDKTLFTATTSRSSSASTKTPYHSQMYENLEKTEIDVPPIQPSTPKALKPSSSRTPSGLVVEVVVPLRTPMTSKVPVCVVSHCSPSQAGPSTQPMETDPPMLVALSNVSDGLAGTPRKRHVPGRLKDYFRHDSSSPSPPPSPKKKARKRSADAFLLAPSGSGQASQTAKRRRKDPDAPQTLVQEPSTASVSTRSRSPSHYSATSSPRATSHALISSATTSQHMPSPASTTTPQLSGPPFIQEISCKSMSKEIRYCGTCITRKGPDLCRFKGLRIFSQGTSRRPLGKGELLAVDPRPQVLPMYPTAWNVVPVPAQYLRVMAVVAGALLPVFEHELSQEPAAGLIERNRELEYRVSCDYCMTSIFSSGWICRDCGREFCHDCHEQIVICTEKSTPEAIASRQKAKKVTHPGHDEYRLMYCLKRMEHTTEYLLPISRFKRGELEQLAEEMRTILKDAEQQIMDIVVDPSLLPTPQAWRLPTDPADPAGIQSLAFHVFKASEITEEAFKQLWSKGDTVVVTDLLGAFEHEWSPRTLIERYGDQECSIVDCDSEAVESWTVRDFFLCFGKYENRDRRLKLKDWPPTSEFSREFPELYKDFMNAVPIPNYTRRDGILNVAAHFPTNEGAIVPDIGPKMYNAFESSELPDGKGSTRLHMDMADAINIMLYAAPRRDGTPGSAVWDIYPAEDSGKIREFLHERFGQSLTDPIHCQHWYLDSKLRKELLETKKVKSWRIYQKAGEAVFIPAGCAHQVCNLADCIKVAVDFVSPENIARCETLTREFREENRSSAWKEDVLQLRQTMFHAWNSLMGLHRGGSRPTDMSG